MSKSLYLNKFDENFVNNYFVVDIGDISKVKVICVLESPHKSEIRLKYPAASASGAIMTKHLVDDESSVPIGKLLHESNELTQNIVLMNSLLVPMQNIYRSLDIKEEFRTTIKSILDLKRITFNNGYNYYEHKRCIINIINNDSVLRCLIDNFKSRLEEYVRGSEYKPYIILCGNESKIIFEYIFNKNIGYVREKGISEINVNIAERGIKVICVPHPSPRNGVSPWDKRPILKPVFEEIRALIV